MKLSLQHSEVMDLLCLHSRLTRRLDRAMRRHGLTLTRFRVLAEIFRLDQPRRDAATAASIAKSMAMDPKSIFDCVADMKRGGLIASQPQGDRANGLRLTSVGRKKFHTGAVVWGDTLDPILSRVPERLRQELNSAIEQANDFFYEELNVARHTSDLKRTKLNKTRAAIKEVEARRKAEREAAKH